MYKIILSVFLLVFISSCSKNLKKPKKINNVSGAINKEEWLEDDNSLDQSLDSLENEDFAEGNEEISPDNASSNFANVKDSGEYKELKGKHEILQKKYDILIRKYAKQKKKL